MNSHSGLNLRHLWSLALSTLAVVALFTAAGCSGSGSRSTLGGADPLAGINDFSNTGNGTALGNVASGSGVSQPAPGSNSDGTFSGLDKSGINNAFNENQQLAPSAADASQIFTPELAAQAKEILNLARQKQDTAVKKLLFMAAMLKHCGELVAQFTPLAGEPLTGGWNGEGACSVSFTVDGDGAGGKYAVSGGTVGTLTADQQGKGAIQAAPVAGNVVDSPKSGTGQGVYAAFFKTKAGTSDCVVGLRLVNPTSKIPEKYQKGMNLMGACLRQTALFISPVFDKMFQDMNPALSQLLQQKFLGLK